MGQTRAEEQREIREALQAGLGDDYLRGQALLRMIEAETERRRARRGR